MTTSTPPRLTGPYNQHTTTDWKRLNCDVSAEDYDYITTICPLHGTKNAILSTFFHYLCARLRLANITTYNPDAVISAIHECTNRSPAHHAGSPNGPGAASSLPVAHTGNAHSSADVSSPTAQRGIGAGRPGSRRTKTA